MYFKIEDFGSLNGHEIKLITISASDGQFVQITNYGGIVHSWYCSDKNGKVGDILLGCKDLSGYQGNHPYFGAVIGRYANRIAHGKFSINGHTYQLKNNLPPHHLHGGVYGFDKKIWLYEIAALDDRITVILRYQSPHMEEGYPGNLDITMGYTFTEDHRLEIEYHATTDEDTHINLTNHCYFNLSAFASETILDHEIMINASTMTETDENLIPTGKIISIEDGPLDFRKYRFLSENIYSEEKDIKKAKGFDHNYVLNQRPSEQKAAEVRDRTSGRTLEVYTDQPGLQLYTGNWLDGILGKTGKYCDFAGLCLETQHFPDTPNHPEFPSTLLKKGEKFYSKTTYKSGVMY